MKKGILLFIGLVFIVIAGYGCNSTSPPAEESKTVPRWHQFPKTEAEIEEFMKNDPLIKEWKKRLQELKIGLGTGEECQALIKTVNYLHEGGDRAQAANQFEEIATKYPEFYHAADCRELSALLKKMAEEDKQWQEPANISKLSLNEQISYWVYKLRDVDCSHQGCPVGFTGCFVILNFGKYSKGPNAAIKLKEIGKPVIPTLINLLNDRRPTRSFSFHRAWPGSRDVLRYQDVALQILNEFIPTPFHSGLLTLETPGCRQKVIEEIKSWWKKHSATWQNPKEPK